MEKIIQHFEEIDIKESTPSTQPAPAGNQTDAPNWRAALEQRGFDADAMAQWLKLARRESFAAAYLTDRTGQSWSVRPYQRASLESRGLRKVHCDGRDVGKTAEIEIIACWAMVACPDSEMMIATQCENHLFPLMNRLARRFQTTPAFAPSLVEMRRSPSWHFRFSNNFILWGRIAGPRGINFQGMHVDWQIVDEAQEMTETAWGELYQALNGDGRRWVYGVPNGLRNTFYRMTCMKDFEQYNWPSSLNPEFTPEKEAELARLYGGRTSPGYVHRVLGQHGEPAHAVFSLDDYLACVDNGLDGIVHIVREGDAFAAPENIAAGHYYLGCDLGYARDPSEFMVYLDAPPHLINVLRVRLEGVNYKRQQEIIEELDRAYRFRRVGLDAGNNGRAVAHALMAQSRDWCDKMEAVEFGATLDVDVMPDGRPARRRAKEFMTELLQRRMTERTLILPPDPDREAQYASHTYTVNAQGQIVYVKGDD
ncbi:MAG TPA: hypothetical protein ENN65_02935, partial [Candidatus Hydrogenedentes bacterium]|nr:hypothetical protein [Candidatus Hydrogenedentota bacterium]